jgi:pilus assembly protein Flp/PilA
MKFFAKLLKNNSAATAIEYGLIAALIAVVTIPLLTNIGKGSNTTYQKVNAGLASN